MFRIHPFLRRRLVERDMDRELRFHLDQEVEERMRLGASRRQAERDARRALGSVSAIQDDCRDALGLRLLDSAAQDVRYAIRSLRRAPVFAVAAIGTLALGIGANTAIFSLVDALLLRWLPVREPAHLVLLTRLQGAQTGTHFSYPQEQRFEQHDEIFASMCAFSDGEVVHVGLPERSDAVGAAWVSGRFYETLGLVPLAGRLLTPADDRLGAPPAAVLSEGYWSRAFGRSPSTLGSQILVEGASVTIVGVSPAGFRGADVGSAADITLALSALPQIEPERSDMLGPGGRWLRILARARRDVTLPEARARLDVLWKDDVRSRLNPRMSSEARQSALASTVELTPAATGASSLRQDFGRPLLVLMAIVSLVLLIACVNVANLLLARASARRREIAVRLAIGASRPRIVRQLLTESALLAVAGAGAGIVIARVVAAAIIALLPATVALDVTPNGHVLAFTSGLAALTTIVFGLGPALRAADTASMPLVGAVNAASGRASARRGHLGDVLVVAQVAASLLLLVGAGLFIRTFWNLRTLDPGFRPDGVLLVDLDARRAGYQGSAARALNRGVLEAAGRLPGVSAASLSSISPLIGGGISLSVAVNDERIHPDEVPINFVGPAFFHTLATPVVVGREFTERDDRNAPGVVMVNQAFVRRYMPAGDPLGQHVSILGSAMAAAGLQVVGVVADAVYERLRDAPPPTVYAPYFQLNDAQLGGGGATFEIYTSASMREAAAAFRAQVMPSLPSTAIVKIRTFTDQLEGSLRQERMLAILASGFGVLAILLCTVGLYGLLGYVVAGRTNEIAIRMALGAQRPQVLRLVMLDGVRLLALGAAIGFPLSWASSRLITSMLFDVSGNDATVSIGAGLTLVWAGLLASYLPARRAVRVDPVVALRSD